MYIYTLVRDKSSYKLFLAFDSFLLHFLLSSFADIIHVINDDHDDELIYNQPKLLKTEECNVKTKNNITHDSGPIALTSKVRRSV